VRAPGPRLSRDDHEELGRLVQRLDRRLQDRRLSAARIA
jgi:hypothetical protein